MDPESSEETPLLLSVENIDHEEIYKRFALTRKRGILAIVSTIGLIPRMYLTYLKVESADTELMVSFRLRNFHSFHTSNCHRPRFDRTHHSVDDLACHKLMIISSSFDFTGMP
jgi:hypothetical protein